MRMITHGALLLAIGACTTRGASSDSARQSSTVDTTRANASAGDLSGPPSVDTTRARAESASAVQGAPQTRGDGRRTNPPLHRVPPPRDASPSIPPRRKL